MGDLIFRLVLPDIYGAEQRKVAIIGKLEECGGGRGRGPLWAGKNCMRGGGGRGGGAYQPNKHKADSGELHSVHCHRLSCNDSSDRNKLEQKLKNKIEIKIKTK